MSTAEETRALDALKDLARKVRAYHVIVDAGADYGSLVYVDAANAMEAAEVALLEAADSLLED